VIVPVVRAGIPCDGAPPMPSPSPRHATLASCLLAISACGKVPADNDRADAAPDSTPDAGPELPALPRSCAEVRAGGKLVDDTYTIDPDGRAGKPGFDVYCAGMASAEPAPREYLTLAHTSTGEAVAAALASKDTSGVSNYSVYPAGGGNACTGDAIRTYTRLRIDPATLLVDASDRTFASTFYSNGAGPCYEASPDASWMAFAMNYGEAADCRGERSSAGSASIDLRDTPFFIGHDAAWRRWPTFRGTARQQIAADRKTAVINGGGGCGVSFLNGGVLPLALDVALPPFVPALVNGGFASGITGWTKTGDDGAFTVATADAFGKRKVVTTRSAGAPAKGTLYQDFVVPHDALLIVFGLAGTGGRVALIDVDKNEEISSFKPSGRDDVFTEQRRVLNAYVGKKLRILIEDAASDAYLTASGFDVIRGGVRSPLANANWHDEGLFASWTGTGDLVDQASDEYTNPADGRYEGWWNLRTGPSPIGYVQQGAFYQTFQVPADAVGLRFVVAAGVAGMEVRLYRGAVTRFPGSAPVRVGTSPGNGVHAAVSWDLTELRGETVTFAIEDFSSVDLGNMVVHESSYVSERSGP
jgi:hypothetical protein